MKYRSELDAMNAIYNQLEKTNELLQQLIDGNITAENLKTTVQPMQPMNHTQKRPYTRRTAK